MTRRGGAGKGSGSEGCRGAEHGQACATGAVAVGAALESAVQVGRGDEGNRQAEMANPTKCRDSLQLDFSPRRTGRWGQFFVLEAIVLVAMTTNTPRHIFFGASTVAS
jgi:hypothetical protein